MSHINTYLAFFGVVFMSVLLTVGLVLFPLEEYVLHTSAEEVREEVATTTLLFVGDIMLDRHIRKSLDAHGSDHVFGEVRELLESADFTLGNLEGPITDSYSVSSGTAVGDMNNMRFTFAPAVASMLAALGFDAVSIGNNHIRDFGTTGVESTKRYLEASGIVFVGDPLRTTPEPRMLEKNGMRIALVGYSEFEGGSEAAAIASIRDGRRQDADVVIVMAHWGAEYEKTPPEAVRLLARRFSEAGADIVIGTHAHVVGEVENIGATRVYYSLGNFAFDQYWEKEVRCGLAVLVSLAKNAQETKIAFEEKEIGMTPNGQTVLGCI